MVEACSCLSKDQLQSGVGIERPCFLEDKLQYDPSCPSQLSPPDDVNPRQTCIILDILMLFAQLYVYEAWVVLEMMGF